MGRIEGSKGSSTVTLFAIVTVLAIIFLGLSIFVRQAMALENSAKGRSDRKAILVEKAHKVMEALEDDDTPESDCAFDKVWDVVDDDEAITLTDISSRINPNDIETGGGFLAFLNETLVKPEKLFTDSYEESVKEFAQQRTDKGFYVDIKRGYSKFFDPEVLDTFFTGYSFFNFNVSYSEVLRDMVKLRCDSETDGEEFHKAYQVYESSELRVNKTNPEIEDWFQREGLTVKNFDKVFPLINGDPLWNVHFMPEELLKAVLEYYETRVSLPKGSKAQKLTGWQVSAENILKQREEFQDGLTLDALRSIIDHNKTLIHPVSNVYQYLGVYTWFWELVIEEKNSKLRWVITRLPKLKDTDDFVFKIVEEDYQL
ncbi:MAG: hypothetical protein JXR70_06230 [Spirochaetales bacterium]|nr:hypothetical protein [Spirochaetales bacterium]